MNNMNITAAQYITDIDGNNNSIQATIDGQELFVPLGDLANRHYAEILKQVEANELVILEAERG